MNSKWVLYHRNHWNTAMKYHDNKIPESELEDLQSLLQDSFDFSSSDIKEKINNFVHDFVLDFYNKLNVLMWQLTDKLNMPKDDINNLADVKAFQHTLLDVVETAMGYNYVIDDFANLKSIFNDIDNKKYDQLIKDWQKYRNEKIKL